MNVVMGRSLIPLLGLSLVLGCSAPPAEPAAEATTPAAAIAIDGSSTVYPLSNEMVEELKFERGEAAPNISVEFSGTGGRFPQILRRGDGH